MSNEIEFEMKGLDQIIKVMKTHASIQIGVLGHSARKPKEGQSKTPTNATIGAVHEFGIPARSFLRVPLARHLESHLEKSDLLSEDTLKQVIKSGTQIPWLKKIAIVAEGIVDDAFESSGDGEWAPWKNPNYHNEGGMLLVDSGQLRQAITSEVKE